MKPHAYHIGCKCYRCVETANKKAAQAIEVTKPGAREVNSRELAKLLIAMGGLVTR